MSPFFVYGLVHQSKQSFKIGWTSSIEARVHVLGAELFNFGFGVALGVDSIETARIVERAAHKAMNEWSLSPDELENIPRSGATEWFSTKGLYDFLFWVRENDKRLKFKAIPLWRNSENSVLQSLGEIVEYGIEPLGRAHVLEKRSTVTRAYGPKTNLSFEVSQCRGSFTLTILPTRNGANSGGNGFILHAASRRDAFSHMESFQDLLQEWRLDAPQIMRNYEKTFFSVAGWQCAQRALADLWVKGLAISRIGGQARTQRVGAIVDGQVMAGFL